MRYFNGFSLEGEEVFFQDILLESDFSVAGFSYGAQLAFEYVYQNPSVRVDRLLLISPAFFQDQKPSFIRTQLRYFKADPKGYGEKFLENVRYPSRVSLRPYFRQGSYESLASLLEYVWDPVKIQVLVDRGVIIEVFLGEADKIVRSDRSLDFFKPLVTTYYRKGVGHLLV